MKDIHSNMREVILLDFRGTKAGRRKLLHLPGNIISATTKKIINVSGNDAHRRPTAAARKEQAGVRFGRFQLKVREFQ